MILLRKTALSLILSLAFFMDANASSGAPDGPPIDEGTTGLPNPQRRLFTPEQRVKFRQRIDGKTNPHLLKQAFIRFCEEHGITHGFTRDQITTAFQNPINDALDALNDLYMKINKNPHTLPPVMPEPVGAGTISPPLQACAADAEIDSPPHHPDRAPTPYDNMSPKEYRKLLNAVAQKEEENQSLRMVLGEKEEEIQSLRRALEKKNPEQERMKQGRNPDSPTFKRLTEAERHSRVKTVDQTRRALSGARAENERLRIEKKEVEALQRELVEVMELSAPPDPSKKKIRSVLDKLQAVLRINIGLRDKEAKAQEMIQALEEQLVRAQKMIQVLEEQLAGTNDRETHI